MINWLVGNNGAGKTVILEEISDLANKDKKNKIVTNLRKIEYDGFDSDKLEAIRKSRNFGEAFGYSDIKINENNRIDVTDSNIKHTQYFLNILSLTCRKGNILILDEPEFGLMSIEMIALREVIQAVKVKYEKVFISTHCELLIGFDDDNYYKTDGYLVYNIERGKVYECIDKL